MDSNIYGARRPGGQWNDSQISPMSYRTNSATWRQVVEGDFFNDGSAWKPVLREPALSLGIRSTGSTMRIIYSYNNTLKLNPKIVIMGSSTSISYGLPTNQSIQYKLQQYANANWGGATINNIGVGGQWSTNWLPTANGGEVGSNIDAALAFNPDFIILMGPTNNADGPKTTLAQWLADLQFIRQYAQQRGARIFIMSPNPRTPYNLTEQQYLSDGCAMQVAEFPYILFNTFDSDLRLKPPATTDPAKGNPIYFQADLFHLNDLGTTYLTDNFLIPIIERELRVNTAYVDFKIEKSADGVTGWVTFDTITDPQIIAKNYTKSVGYYRVTGKLKNGVYLPVSNVVQVTNISPTANAGSDINPASGTTTINVTGSGTDPDGTIVSYLWEIVAGSTAGASLVNATTATVTINGMTDNGVYTLRLTVTDNNGATGSDLMVITVAPSAGFTLHQWNMSPAPQVVAGWTNLSGNPSTGTISGVSNGLTCESIGNWNALGGAAGNNLGSDGLNPTDPAFVFPPLVTVNCWFNYGQDYVAGRMNIRISGFTPGEVVPEINLLGSRDSVNGGGVAFATRLMDLYCKDAGGITKNALYNVKDNQMTLCSFFNKIADASGYIELGAWRPSPQDNNHQIGYCNALQVKRSA